MHLRKVKGVDVCNALVRNISELLTELRITECRAHRPSPSSSSSLPSNNSPPNSLFPNHIDIFSFLEHSTLSLVSSYLIFIFSAKISISQVDHPKPKLGPPVICSHSIPWFHLNITLLIICVIVVFSLYSKYHDGRDLC